MGIVVSSIVCQDRSRPGISITGRCASPRHGTVLRAALYRESGFVQWPLADFRARARPEPALSRPMSLHLA
jgi:hypothetical protein